MVDAKSIKDTVSKKINNARSRISSQLPAHKHCRICGIDIKATSEDRICKNNECVNEFEKRGKNDKMMRIMFVVFFLAIVAPIALRLLGYGG
jgi:predicted nucleic acid-binding Zn ribbon protein